MKEFISDVFEKTKLKDGNRILNKEEVLYQIYKLNLKLILLIGIIGILYIGSYYLSKWGGI